MMINKYCLLSFIAISVLNSLNCKPLLYKLTTTDKVVVYNKFLLAGSTNNILNAFEFPLQRNIDTTQNKKIKVEVKNLDNALSDYEKLRKHRQQKLGGISFGGEFYESNKKHYFLYFENAKLIIDFTDMREYWLKEGLDL